MRPTVLFVDDDPNLLQGIARSLRKEPYRIVCAETVESARSLLDAESIDVVICDEHLPGTSGSEFMAELRRMHPATMRVMLTGEATLGAAVHAINGGEIFRFLLKPCGHGELVETITLALSQKRLMDQCRSALRMLQRQTALLSALERRSPGIAARTASSLSATIAAREAGPGSTETLVGEIEAEIDRARGVMGA